MSVRVVIVGGGQAGFQVAASLRGKRFDGPVTILADEPVPPYQRPPLSKAYLKGEASEMSVLLRPKEYYAAHTIDLRLHNAVTTIDQEARRVTLADGTSLDYD